MHSAELVSRNEEQRVNHNSSVSLRFLDVPVPNSIIKHSEVQTIVSVIKNVFLGQFCCFTVYFCITFKTQAP